jgi:hypothetical protein
MLVVMGMFIAWRYATYNDFLPNTFYAKSYGGAQRIVLGFKYLLAGLGYTTGPLAVFFFLPFIVSKRLSREFSFLLLLISCSVLFVLYSGGDWMPGYRFFIPVFGLIALVCGMGVHLAVEAWRSSHTVGKLPAFVLIPALLVLCGIRMNEDRIFIRGMIPELETGIRTIRWTSLPEHEAAAEWLARHTAGRITVATGEAGFIGYKNMNMYLLDCNGLMDKAVARERLKNTLTPADYFLDQQPDFIILKGLSPADDRLNRPASDYISAFLQSPRFQHDYNLCFQFQSTGIYKRR